jgi:hypothetical protein
MCEAIDHRGGLNPIIGAEPSQATRKVVDLDSVQPWRAGFVTVSQCEVRFAIHVTIFA